MRKLALLLACNYMRVDNYAAQRIRIAKHVGRPSSAVVREAHIRCSAPGRDYQAFPMIY
jgi:hypothetical protein